MSTSDIDRPITKAEKCEGQFQTASADGGPGQRKSQTKIQPPLPLRTNKQISAESLSEVLKVATKGASAAASRPSNYVCNSIDTQKYRHGLIPIVKMSSELATEKNENGAILNRFLSSEGCETSQSILSSSSSDNEDGLYQNWRHVTSDEPSLTSQTFDKRVVDTAPRHLEDNSGVRFYEGSGAKDSYDPHANAYGGLARNQGSSQKQMRHLAAVHGADGQDSDSGDDTRKNSVLKSRNAGKLSLSQQQLKKGLQTGYLNSSIDLAAGEGSELMVKRQILKNMPPMELTSVRRYYSLKPDMAFGWRPEDIHGAPIPMRFDYEQNEVPMNPESGADLPIYYLSNRFSDSLDMHNRFSNKLKMLGPDEIPSYHFKFPPNQNVIDAMGQKDADKLRGANPNVQKMFTGVSPLLTEPTVERALPLLKGQGKDWDRGFLQQQMNSLKEMSGPKDECLLFDSSFESGNLDMVIQVAPTEYDMYMRVDSNTRGHHQWFYFKVNNQNKIGTVKFNFVNFTKRQSLYMHGMRVNVKSMLEIASQKAKLPSGTPVTALKNEGWVKSGDNITYKLSKLSQNYSNYNSNVDGVAQPVFRRVGRKKYFMLTFEHTFTKPNDEVYFAYALPYTFSKLHNFIKEIVVNHQKHVSELEHFQQSSTSDQNNQSVDQKRPPILLTVPVTKSEHAYIKESRFCYSLSGLEVPELTITSQVNKLQGQPSGASIEIDRNEFDDKCEAPVFKYKKYVIIGARVHPGESNASFIMQGFLKFIVGQSQDAINLRKRFIFRIVPMTNPDGVIAGNYRTSLSGNDLNRTFLTPNPKLHPIVDHIKKLCRDIQANAQQPEPIAAFMDIHGHSRKKSVFMYGPHYPLHNEGYFKSKILPKLLDDKTEMFRFYSCKFRIEKSKVKTARVVLFREFGIMNCFTLEASFHGFIDKDRSTSEFTTESLEKVGQLLGETLADYAEMVDEDDRQKAQVREALKNKKKKMKAKDLTRAIQRQQKSFVSRDSSVANGSEKNQSDFVDGVGQGVVAARTALSKPRGVVRSASIQNNQSTKVSGRVSESNNFSDDGGTTVNARKKSNYTNVDKTGNLNKDGVTATHQSDIMELISEEELSVCRSEGSPPRKAKKGKIRGEDHHDGVANKRNRKDGGVSVAKKTSTGGVGSTKGLKLKPEGVKKPSDFQAQDSTAVDHAQGGTEGQKRQKKQTAMSAFLNQLKKQESESEQRGDCSEDDDELDDDSSCAKSFSADELSENDLKELQGNILGAIKHFDQLYNKATFKEKYSKEKVEAKKQKKLQKEQKVKEQEAELKRKRKLKQDEARQKMAPVATMPFQVKGSGNGGNSCTLVMQRIREQRQSTQLAQPPFMSSVGNGVRKTLAGGAGPQAPAEQQPTFGFMQRHKKSVNAMEKDAQARALSDINFNVPKCTSNLEVTSQVSKVRTTQKKRDGSLTSAPVGVKGLAAISDMRNSSKNPQTEAKRDKGVNGGGEVVEQQLLQMPKVRQQQPRLNYKQSRMLKPSNHSVNTAKSPTSGKHGVTTCKASKVSRAIKAHDEQKKQHLFDALNGSSGGGGTTKHTPKADGGLFLKHGGGAQVSKSSHSKTIPVTNVSPQSQQVLPPSSSNAAEDQRSNYHGQQHQFHIELDQPKIISKTIKTKTNVDLAMDQRDEHGCGSQSNHIKQSLMNDNTTYRVKSGDQRRNYRSSQRCSSGNIIQRSKAANLAKENTFLSKINGSHQLVGQQQQPSSLQNPTKQQSFSLRSQAQWPPSSKTQYQSFIGHNSHRDSTQPQFGVVGLSTKNTNKIGSSNYDDSGFENTFHQSASAFAMIQQPTMSFEQQRNSELNSKFVSTANVSLSNQPQHSNTVKAVSIELCSQQQQQQQPQVANTNGTIFSEIGNQVRNILTIGGSKGGAGASAAGVPLQSKQKETSSLNAQFSLQSQPRIKNLGKQDASTSLAISGSHLNGNTNHLNMPPSSKPSFSFQGGAAPSGGVNFCCLSQGDLNRDNNNNFRQPATAIDNSAPVRQGKVSQYQTAAQASNDPNVSFTKLVGIQKLIANKQKAGSSSSQSFQQGRRRNLKASNVLMQQHNQVSSSNGFAKGGLTRGGSYWHVEGGNTEATAAITSDQKYPNWIPHGDQKAATSTKINGEKTASTLNNIHHKENNVQTVMSHVANRNYN